MGLGRLFNIQKQAHKRRRGTVVTDYTTHGEQEVDSPIFFDLEQLGSTDLACAAAAPIADEITEASSAQHDDWYEGTTEVSSAQQDDWYKGTTEIHSDLEYSKDDGDDDDYERRDDDDDERLSCISNVDASSQLQNAFMYYSDHGNAMACNHDDVMNFEDEQDVSMELDSDDVPQYTSQYGLSTSAGKTGFLHSSGRPTLRQEASDGMKRRTIDSEFEEYFASLLLK